MLAGIRAIIFISLSAALLFIPAHDGPGEIIITRERAPLAESVKLTTVASGFELPVYLTHAGDGSGRLFLVERTGRIWALKDGWRAPRPFLDLSDLITELDFTPLTQEQGLLGLAFHPQFSSNGYLYVHYTDQAGAVVVARYEVESENHGSADAESAKLIFTLPQPFKAHNGGQLAFGPDGYLYISLGDGGDANDQLDAGQNLQMLLATIIRIDVDSGDPYAIPPDNPFVGDPAALDEIWAYGLRNPWRFSFDRATGDLYISDVGQHTWEEFNFQKADSPGGENYGWAAYEGSRPFKGGPAPNHAAPFYEYDHSLGCAAIGGYVYRGAAIPDLQAVYISGDWCSGRIFASWRDHELEWHTLEMTRAELAVNSFGEDEAGEIYLVDNDGTLFRLDPAA